MRKPDLMAVKANDDTPCGCGHAHLAHQHYRRGTDCAQCECRRFIAARVARVSKIGERRGFRFTRRPRSAAA